MTLSKYFNNLTQKLTNNFNTWNEGLYLDYLQKVYLNNWLINFLIISTMLINEAYLFKNLIHFPITVLRRLNRLKLTLVTTFITLIPLMLFNLILILTLILILI